MKNKIFTHLLLMVLFLLNGCKDFVQVEIPPNQLSSANAFKEEGSASAAIVGIYSNLATGSLSANMQLAMDYYSGNLVYNGNDDSYSQFVDHRIQADNSFISSFWSALYQYIHYVNSSIEALKVSQIDQTLKNQLIGEALFMRAFCYYYLVNLWGDVPMVLSSDWEVNQSLGRAKQKSVYEQIVNDLESSKNFLHKNEVQHRVRVNYYCAPALLSRIYVHLEEWEKAEENASEVINNPSYRLEEIGAVFTINSREVIWQLMSINSSYLNTNIGQQVIPRLSTSIPDVSISKNVLTLFPHEDKREINWSNSNVVNKIEYRYPYKYKEGFSSVEKKENLVVLRLGEQYLNRSEARSMLGDLDNALDDLNKIRLRASLPKIELFTEEAIQAAIEKERRLEFFAEWGIAWLGGKREFPLWPIPLSQLDANPYLDQN